jgi:hypothetical protein
MKNSAQQQAYLSSITKPREGPCSNVMDAEAHALQAQHRNRYAGVSIKPMFTGYGVNSQPIQGVPTRAY